MKRRQSFFVHHAWFIIAVTAVLAIMGCHERRTYHHYQPVNTSCWAMTDTLRFTPENIDYEGDYRVSIGARVDDHYAYRNLWLVVEQRTLKGLRTAHRDTVNLILADSHGAWLTQGVVLHVAEEEVATTRLEKDECYEFLVYHIMSDQHLVGVNDVGVTLSPD